jgi:hypothetical protein
MRRKTRLPEHTDGGCVLVADFCCDHAGPTAWSSESLNAKEIRVITVLTEPRGGESDASVAKDLPNSSVTHLVNGTNRDGFMIARRSHYGRQGRQERQGKK